MELLTRDLGIYRMSASESFAFGGDVTYDVANNGNRLFSLIGFYRVPVLEGDGMWRCDYPLERKNFALPIDERIVGSAAGKKVYRAATCMFQATLEEAAGLLNCFSGNVPLIGFEWEFSFANGTFENDGGPPTPRTITCAATVTAVEPAALETVADALRMIRDVVEYQQNQEALTDHFGRPRRLKLADADALAAERLRERRRRRMQGLGL